jgi:hypothetical protein
LKGRTAAKNADPAHDHVPPSGSLELPATDPDALTRLERFGGVKLLDEMIALFLLNARERITAAATGLGAATRQRSRTPCTP